MSKVINFPKMPITLIAQTQDEIDNSIFELLESFAGKSLNWDIELIGNVRDSIISELAERDLLDENSFYPPFDEEQEFQPRSLSHGVYLIVTESSINPFSIILSFVAAAVIFGFVFIVLPQIF